MDLGMAGYVTQTSPAGGPTRKYSAPAIPVLQQQQSQYGMTPAGQPQFLQQQHQQPSGAQFYFHQNQSHPAGNAYDHPYGHMPQQQQQQNMPRYNGNLFQTNGHPATHSQQHIPAYPSNLVPNVNRLHNNTLPSSKEDVGFTGFGGSLEEYMDDDIDADYDALGTQASTPGNYDFSTNASVTSLNMLAATSGNQATRTSGHANGPPGGSVPSYGSTPVAYQGHHQQQQQQQTGYLQQPQRSQPLAHQSQRGQQNMGFYNNASGAQSTPNLAWTLNSQLQMSPPRR